jgi:hypothetical protein
MPARFHSAAHRGDLGFPLFHGALSPEHVLTEFPIIPLPSSNFRFPISNFLLKIYQNLKLNSIFSLILELIFLFLVGKIENS